MSYVIEYDGFLQKVKKTFGTKEAAVYWLRATGKQQLISDLKEVNISDTIAAIKETIEKETGLKISVKKESVKSSLRGYITFTAKKENGIYPDWTHNFSKKMNEDYKGIEPHPTFCNLNRFSLYVGNEAYNA